MKTLQFTQPEIDLLREALREYRKQFSRERRPEDVQVVTAVDNVLQKLPGGEGSVEADS
jgi:hypothetical protein